MGYAHHLQSTGDAQRQRNRRVLARACQVVGQTHADFYRVAGGQRYRHVGQNHHVAAYRGFGAACGHGVVVDRHGHDAQAAVKAFRHGVAELFAARHIDQSGPEHHRLVTLAFEGVQMLPPFAFTVTTGGSALHQFFELRKNHVQRLLGVDFQCPLLKEMFQQVGGFVARYLQNSFVHGKYDGPRGLVAGQFHFDKLAGFHQFRTRQGDVAAAACKTAGKRDDAITQGAGVHLIRRQVTREMHTDIA